MKFLKFALAKGLTWFTARDELRQLKFTITLTAIFLIPLCQAQDHSKRITFSQGDPALVMVENDQTGEYSYSASWKGHIALTGKLVVEYESDRTPGSSNLADTEGAAYFEPDAKSLKKLPATKSFYPAPVTPLWLFGDNTSPRDLLQPLIGKKAYQKIAEGQSLRYEFPAKVWIKSYGTSVECDHRSYYIEIERLELLGPELSTQTDELNARC